MAQLSKTKIDQLGDRLRRGFPSENDLRLLDDYRKSFGEAYETVVGSIRGQLQLEPSGRPAKSTSSIIEKLHRESIRLSQVQDIAGCRLVVIDVAEQDRVVTSLSNRFPGASVVDRRVNPTYGYRAVHVIARVSGKLIEIQIRTPLQHLWAEFSEKLSDMVDPAIKYGGGPDVIRQALASISTGIASMEAYEGELAQAQAQDVNGKYQKSFQYVRERMLHLKKELADDLSKAISWLESQKGENR